MCQSHQSNRVKFPAKPLSAAEALNRAYHLPADADAAVLVARLVKRGFDAAQVDPTSDFDLTAQIVFARDAIDKVEAAFAAADGAELDAAKVLFDAGVTFGSPVIGYVERLVRAVNRSSEVKASTFLGQVEAILNPI